VVLSYFNRDLTRNNTVPSLTGLRSHRD